MAYNKTSYVDGITPLNARNLNNSENAIDQVAKDISSISSALVKVDDKANGKAPLVHRHTISDIENLEDFEAYDDTEVRGLIDTLDVETIKSTDYNGDVDVEIVPNVMTRLNEVEDTVGAFDSTKANKSYVDEELNKVNSQYENVANVEIPKINSQLETKVNKSETGWATLNTFNEETRSVIQGMEIGQVNAVLGMRNVKDINTDFLYVNLYRPTTIAKLGNTIDYATGNYVALNSSSTTGRIAVKQGNSYIFSVKNEWFAKFFNKWRCYDKNNLYLGTSVQIASYPLATGITCGDIFEKNGRWQQTITLSSNTNVAYIESVIVESYANHTQSQLDSVVSTIQIEDNVSEWTGKLGIDGSSKLKDVLIPNKLNEKIAKIENDILNINTINSKDYLYGKKIGCAGDSITQGINPDGGFFKNYGEIIAERNGMVYKNYGISGSTMTNIAGKNPFSDTRYLNMDNDLDYLLIWFGWNDSAYATLGTISDTVDTTFYGAWNKVLPALIKKYPLCKIGLITPYGVNDSKNTQGTKPGFRQAVRDIALKFGVPCLDLEDKNTPLIWLRNDVDQETRWCRLNTFTYDTTHPNQTGYNYMSTFIENFVRGL